MLYEPLHHKYRPQTFAQLVGQEAIATTLSNALRQQRIAPAYLFTGPRGTGKTSSARILAKSLNCSQSAVPTDAPCGTCEICRRIAKGNALDVIEIDAASNTGVDNIRELIERAQFAPVECRYKVYIIDEVHMLSTAAFNALLKTLEEPPAQVVFVLATTDPQRVLPTIISRCQRFDYRRIPLVAMVDHLVAIAQKESIDISPEAVELVAQIAQGGLRDAESLLDQLSLLDGQITVERVWDLVGAVPERDLLALVQAIAQDDGTAVLDQVRHLMNRGREPLIVLQNLASFYRDLLIAKTAGDRRDLVTLTQPTWDELCAFAQSVSLHTILHGQQHLRESEVQVKNTTQPRLWLEITLMGLLPSTLQLQHTADMGTGHPVGNAVEPAVANSGRSPHPVPVPPQPIAPPSSTTQETARPTATNGAPPSPTEANSPPSSQTPSQSSLPAETSPPPNPSTPHPPTPSPTQPPTSPSPLTDSPGYAAFQQEKLNQLWNTVLANITRLGTRALLQQYGCLLGFDGRMARIGIKTKNLMGIAQSKQTDIEEAFQKVHGTKVMISLEVGSLGEEATPASPARPSPAPPTVSESSPTSFSSEPSSPSTNAPASQPPVSQNSAFVSSNKGVRPDAVSPQPDPLSSVPSTIDASETLPVQEHPPLSGSVADVAAPHSASPSPLPVESWQAEDEVTKAAKSLAQMFNGAIVNLDDDLDGLPLLSPPSNAYEQNGHGTPLTPRENRQETNPEMNKTDRMPGRSLTDFNSLPNPTPKRPINMDDVPF